MVRVSFYELSTEDESSYFNTVARLCVKAQEQGYKTLIATESEEQAEQLDSFLWDNPDGRFLPHNRMSGSTLEDPDNIEVKTIIVSLDNLGFSGDLLINLSTTVPKPIDKFERILDFSFVQKPRAYHEKCTEYKKLGCHLDALVRVPSS